MTKKFLLAAVFSCLASVPSMFGSTIFAYCSGTPLSFANGNGSGSVSCQTLSALGVTGVTVNAVDLYYLADWQFGSAPTNTVSEVFTPTGGTWVPTNNTCTITGGGTSGSQPCTPNGLPTAGTLLGSTSYAIAGNVATGSNAAAIALSGTTVGIVSTLTAGTVATSSGGAIIGYDYTVPTTGAPEPTTLALVGSALIGLGVIGRKKMAR